jgi:hypothetical protein
MHWSKRQLPPSPLVIRLCRNDFLNRESQVRFLPGARGEIVELLPGSSISPLCDFGRCFPDRLRLMLYTVPPDL